MGHKTSASQVDFDSLAALYARLDASRVAQKLDALAAHIAAEGAELLTSPPLLRFVVLAFEHPLFAEPTPEWSDTFARSERGLD